MLVLFDIDDTLVDHGAADRGTSSAARELTDAEAVTPPQTERGN